MRASGVTASGVPGPVVTPRRGRGDVGFVLLMMQASAGLLGVLGLMVLTGSPVVAVVPLAGPVAQVTLAICVGRGRRWAWAVVIAMETLFVYAFVAGGLLGLSPPVDMTVTLTGLLTRLGLPVALICLGVLELAAPTRPSALVERSPLVGPATSGPLVGPAGPSPLVGPAGAVQR
jgi:hypothetical protein